MVGRRGGRPPKTAVPRLQLLPIPAGQRRQTQATGVTARARVRAASARAPMTAFWLHPSGAPDSGPPNPCRAASVPPMLPYRRCQRQIHIGNAGWVEGTQCPGAGCCGLCRQRLFWTSRRSTRSMDVDPNALGGGSGPPRARRARLSAGPGEANTSTKANRHVYQDHAKGAAEMGLAGTGG